MCNCNVYEKEVRLLGLPLTSSIAALVTPPGHITVRVSDASWKWTVALVSAKIQEVESSKKLLILNIGPAVED